MKNDDYVCPKCNRLNMVDARVCAFCYTEMPNPKQVKARRPLNPFIIAGVIAAFAGAAAVAVMVTNKPAEVETNTVVPAPTKRVAVRPTAIAVAPTSVPLPKGFVQEVVDVEPTATPVPVMGIPQPARRPVRPIATSKPRGRKLLSREIGTWSGTGPMQTEKFTLTTGDAFASFSTGPDGDYPGLLSAFLTDSSGQPVQLVANVSGKETGTSSIYKKGEFYFDINATQRWVIILKEFYYEYE